MIKLDTNPTFIEVSPASHPTPEPAHRLMVLVPGPEVDLALAARRIWELAETTEARILFIGLYDDETQEPGLRRELVTLSSMVNYDKVTAETEVIFGTNWVTTVKSRVRPGDMVVCFDEHQVGRAHRPMSQILRSNLDVPLYILSGFPLQQPSRTVRPTQIIAWLGALAIVIGFFVLQVRIVRSSNDWTTIWLLLSVLMEYWLIQAWNKSV